MAWIINFYIKINLKGFDVDKYFIKDNKYNGVLTKLLS